MTVDEFPPLHPRVERFLLAVLDYTGSANGTRDEAERALVEALHFLTHHGKPDDVAAISSFVADLLGGRVLFDDPSRVIAVARSLALELPDPPTDEPSSMVDRLRARLLTSSQVEDLPAPEYLLDGYIVENSLGMIYGKRGSYKSITLLDWSASIATGSWWFGREVRQGPVLYVVAEGLTGMGQRVRAWREHRRTYQLGGLYFLAGAVNLLSLPDVIALCTIAVELKPVFVAVDTLGRSMPGGDENSSRDMTTIVDNLDRLRLATRAAVWIAHHGNRAEGTPRGHTSLEAAMDTIVECKGAENRLLLTVDKQKDDAPAAQRHLHVVEAGDSVVLDDRPDPNRGDELPGKASEVLRALELVALDDGVSSTTWSESALGLKVSKSTFHEHKKTLIVRGLVRQIGEGRTARFAVAATDQDPLGDF